MPQFTPEWYERWKTKNNPADKRLGAHSCDKKRDVLHCQPQEPGVETKVRQQFRVTIVLKYSDQRVRDPDAALSTILDCLVATRRLTERYARNPRNVR